MMSVKNFFLILCLMSSSDSVFGMIPKQKEIPIAFLSDIDFRKKQRANLNETLKKLEKRRQASEKQITEKLSKISLDIEKFQKEKDDKIVTLLNERKQSLLNTQELWQSDLDLVDQHIKLITEIIEFLQEGQDYLKSSYSWKEFQEAQNKTSAYITKIDTTKNKLSSMRELKEASKIRLASLEKQLEIKKGTPLNENDSQESRIIYDLEQQVLQEKIEHTQLAIKKAQQEEPYYNDIIEFEQLKLNRHKEMLGIIERRVIITAQDQLFTKQAWDEAKEKAAEKQKELTRAIEEKKQEKSLLTGMLADVKENIASLKKTGKKESVDYTLQESEEIKLQAAISNLEKKIRILEAQTAIAKIQAKDKELAHETIGIRLLLKEKPDDVTMVLAPFKEKRSSFEAASMKIRPEVSAVESQMDVKRLLTIIENIRKEVTINQVSAFQKYPNKKEKILDNLNVAEKNLEEQIKQILDNFKENTIIYELQKKVLNTYDLIIEDLKSRQKLQTIWKRSDKAISQTALLRSLREAEIFFKKLYWDTPLYIGPAAIIKTARSFSIDTLFALFCFLIFYILSYLFLTFLLILVKRREIDILQRYKGHPYYVTLRLILTFADFMQENLLILFSWVFIFIHIFFDFRFIFSSIKVFATPYSISLFYLLSIPILVYLSHGFIYKLKELNSQLSYLLFAESFQAKFITLASIFCYATAVLMPLRLSFLHYTRQYYSDFATVLLAAYSLIVIGLVLFSFSKEDILKWIPSSNNFLIWSKGKINKHYYPVFFFLMGLLILANPYIGYSNLAWFLAFAIPASTFIIVFVFSVHFYLRQYAVFIFMKEDDDEIIDKFQHAKAYYGFFVIFSFLFFLFCGFVMVSYLWGIDYTPSDLWKAIAEQWVVTVGPSQKVGIIQFCLLGLFIASGFFLSSFIHKFIFNKLFDILRLEPGIQNTMSRLVHYIIVFIAIVMGMNAIYLGQFILWIAAPLGVGLGFGLKDIAADLVGGFLILIERPMEIGSFVEIDEKLGTVHKISARSTTLITAKNHSIVIPNKDLVSKWIINWGQGRFAVGFEMSVRVQHSSDTDLTKELIRTVVQSHPLILKVPNIIVRLEDIEESALVYLIRAFISARRVKEQWTIASDLRIGVIQSLKEHNIKLATPTRMIYGGSIKENGNEGKAIEIKFDKE